jgi:hypothetical protein
MAGAAAEDGRMSDPKLAELIARKMYCSLRWGGSESSYDYAPLGLKDHYRALALVAMNVIETYEPEPPVETIGKGLDDAITDELEHGPKPIMKE